MLSILRLRMRGIAMYFFLLLLVSNSDGGQGSSLLATAPQILGNDLQRNRIDTLLEKLRENRSCLQLVKAQSLGLRGGELRSAHPKNIMPDIGCAKCMMSCGKCEGCGKDKTILTPDFLELGSVLGHGSFSTVHLGSSVRWGAVAVKKVTVVGEEPTLVKRLSREVQILSELNHPNIVRLLDVHYEELGNTRSASLVFEPCGGGELFDFVNGIDIMANGDRVWQDLRFGMEHSTQHGLVTEADLARIIQQILVAVDYLHENNIAHRDLKLENVLLDEPFVSGRTNRVKLIDFGFSKAVADGERMFTACGSTLYIAPEVLTAKETGVGYGLECDVWAVGVMSFILLTCNPPFAGATPAETLASVRAGTYAFPGKVPLSAEARDFVRLLLVPDPARRATCADALAHPWITMHAEPAAAAPAEAGEAGGAPAGWDRVLWGCVPRALRAVPRRIGSLIAHAHAHAAAAPPAHPPARPAAAQGV